MGSDRLSTNFWRSEFACKCGCGFDTVDAELLVLLEKIRKHFDAPVWITSGARCKAHNAAVGGGEFSQHLLGRAADIVVDGIPADLVGELAAQIGAGGVGRYADFTHVDSRTHEVARWSG